MSFQLSRLNRSLAVWLRWLPTILLGCLFIVAARDRFTLPSTPIADPDVWCYLNPPLSKLLGGAFEHTYGQCFLYPGMLYVILASGADCRWITVVQHLLGLGTGALLLVAWRQARGFILAPRVPWSFFDLGGIAMAAVYLLSTTSTHFECLLRPEAVFPFFAVLNICCNLAFIRHRFFADARARTGSRRRILACGTAAVFTCVMTWLLKPSFAAMLLLANLPVAISLFLRGSAWRDKLALVCVPATAAGLLLVLPEARLRASDPASLTFLPESLFSVHADLIRDQMADDLAQHRTAPYDPEWLRKAHAQLALEIQVSARHRALPSLGFDPDYVKMQTSYIGWAEQELGEEKAIAFFRDYYGRVWRRNPRAMLRKIWRQMRVFYRWNGCPAYTSYHTLDLQPEYARSAVVFGPALAASDSGLGSYSNREKTDRYPPMRAYIVQCEQLAQVSTGVRSQRWVETVTRFLAATYLPLCLGTIVLAGACLVFRAFRARYGPAIGVLVLLYSYNFGTTLSLSIGHSMDFGRYAMYQLAFTLLPQAICLWMTSELSLAAALWVKRRYQADVICWLNGTIPADQAWSGLGGDLQPLPAPALSQERRLSVAILDLAASPHGGTPWRASCREAFPAVQVSVANKFDGELARFHGDALLVADSSDARTWSPDMVGSLLQSYLDDPADLILAPAAPRRRWAHLFVILMERCVGRAPANPFTGMRLLSRRFCDSFPQVVLPGDGEPESKRKIALSTCVQAVGWGFLMRELSGSPKDGATCGTGVAEPAPPGMGERWSLLRNLFVLCCKCRPMRCLGMVTVVCLLLAVVFGSLAVQRKSHARHRYTVHRSKVVIAAALAVAALTSAAYAVILERRRRHWHADFLLRQSS